MLFADDLLRFGFSDLALNCLKPFIKYNENAELKYIRMLINTGEEVYILEAEILLNERLTDQAHNLNLLKLKIDLLYKTGRKRLAAQELEKLIDLDPSVSNAYNAVVIKSELGEKGLSKYAKILEKDDDNPGSLIASALCYKSEGNYMQAEYLGYKSLAKNKDAINDAAIDLIYANYIVITLYPFIPRKEDEKVELDEIEVDSAFELIDGSEKLWCAVDSDNTLFNEKSILKFIGAIHYQPNDPHIINLIGSKISTNVKYLGKEYKINQIITAKAKATRYCLEIYSAHRPDSTFLKPVKIDNSDPMLSMLPMLFEQEKRQKELLEQYNLKNNIGIPLWLISQQFGHNLLDGIFYILNKTNQIFYAGEVVLFNPQNVGLVLSPSSILLLNILNVFDSIKNISEEIHISKFTYDYFLDELEKINVHDKRVKMTIGMENGKPFVSKITEEHFQNRREFFRNIIEKMNDYKITNIDISKSELDNRSQIIKFISLPEFTSLYLANSINGIYICDDLVVRKTSNVLLQKNITTNSISILYLMFKENLEALFEHLDKLAKANYLYVYDLRLLLSLIEKILKEYKILGSDTIYGRLQNMIHDSLSTIQQLSLYEPILLNVISILHKKGIDKYSDYIIKSIIRELWIYYSLYNLEEAALINKIVSISDTERDFEFFKAILIEIKTGNIN